MSRQMNNNRSAVPARKPFCKVCHDAGKPESDYTSHYVRSLPDRQGNTTVTCPTLLNTECRYCYGVGHTAKFCPVLASRKKDDERRHREEERRTRESQKPVVKSTVPVNAYAALYESDDEVETPKVVVKEEFPALGAPSKRVENTGYAAAAAKPAPVVETKAHSLPAGFTVLKKGATYENTEPEKKMVSIPHKTRWTSWISDDEDEDEDEGYFANSDW